MTVGPLWIVGSRSFAGEVADFAEDCGFDVQGLLEPYDRDRVGRRVHDLPVSWLEDGSPDLAVIATGEPDRRGIVARAESAGWRLATLVHPRAHVSRRSSVGEGAVLAPGVVVGAFSEVGEHAVLGRGALVGHHTAIEPFATLNPGVNVAGNVRVGEGAFLGMGAVVRDHLTIGESALVAAGAVVVDDVPAGVQVRGLPAKPHQHGEAPAQGPEGRGARVPE
jgi:sugar O-acyltransferase (sialic acid O-acetyltransferase NeuD family)